MAEFGIDIIRRGDGVGDFLPKDGAEAVAKAVEGDAKGAFGEAYAGGDVRVGSFGGAAGERGGDGVEPCLASSGGVFGAQAGGRGVEKGERPGAVIGGVRGRAGRGMEFYGLRGIVGVSGPATALGCTDAGALAGEMVLEDAEKPGAEAAALAAGGGKRIVAEDGGEEALDEVFGVRRG